MFDGFTIPNAVNPAHPDGIVPAVIDFLHLEWSGVTRTLHWSDAADQFAGYFLENSATIEVAATTPPSLGRDGFHFQSDPAETTVSHFAQIGHDHNGTFFPG